MLLISVLLGIACGQQIVCSELQNTYIVLSIPKVVIINCNLWYIIILLYALGDFSVFTYNTR